MSTLAPTPKYYYHFQLYRYTGLRHHFSVIVKNYDSIYVKWNMEFLPTLQALFTLTVALR